MNLSEEAAQWQDTVAYAVDIRDRFHECLRADAALSAHRLYTRHRGMGEDAFHWLWKLIVDEMPPGFRFLEVGVYKGQVLSLVRLLSDRLGHQAEIVGVTLLSTFAGSRSPFQDCDYRAAIREMHDRFDQQMPDLVVGDSIHEDTHDKIKLLAPFDVVFVDGCHDYAYVASDLLFYGGLVKVGGFLVVDDAANDLRQPARGWFKGIESVTRAVRTVILTDPRWAHVITVCHDRLFRRVK